MAKTYQDLINEARVILQDTDSDGYRTDGSKILAILNRGLQELGRIRPDAFWDRYDEAAEDILIPEVVNTDPDPDTDPTELDETEDAKVALSDPLDIPMQFYQPLIFFVVGMTELIDDEFADDGRASILVNQFKQTVMSL